MPRVSVIIATKNRETHLRSVSLPSLLRQENAPSFEVIVWDASDNERSHALVEQFAAENLSLEVRYFKAPRVGLARQRNDAVKVADGDIIFFIDDDSEVSPDGLHALAEMFTADESLIGGCLSLDYQFPTGTEPAIMKATGIFAQLLKAYYRLFEPAKKASGYYPPIAPTRSGPIYYLFGCDMAFRRKVFATHSFDERLHRFTNYLICDDLLFSRVLIQEGHPFKVAQEGYVIHRAAAGGRLHFGFNMGRVEGYSAGLVWFVAAFPWSKWTIFPFAWARVGVFCAMLLECLKRPWQFIRWRRMIGYLSGLWTFFWEELFGLSNRRKRTAP